MLGFEKILQENVSQPLWLNIAVLTIFGFFGYKLVRWILATRQAAKDFIAHVVDEKVPASIRDSLKNGVREMVLDLNAKQDVEWRKAMADAFRDHEEREERTVKALIESTRKDTHTCNEEVLNKLAEHDDRLKRVEAMLKKEDREPES